MSLHDPTIDYRNACYDCNINLSSSVGAATSGSASAASLNPSFTSADSVQAYKNFLLLIARVFDLVNIDSNACILWKDFINFIVRTGRFNLTANTRHVILSYMPSKTPWTYILPIAKVGSSNLYFTCNVEVNV